MFNDAIADVFGPRFASPFLGRHADAQLNTLYRNRKNFNYLVNQGRGAESVLFRALAGAVVRRDYRDYKDATVQYFVCCSNNFFDTTSAHIINIKDFPVVAPNGKEYKITFRLQNFPNPKVKEGTY